MYHYIINHYHVKESSCSNNCIKMEVDGVDETFISTKLFFQVPIKYFQYDMIKPPSLGVLAESRYSDRNMIIRDSKFPEFLPSQVQLLSKKRRDLCGWKKLILATSLQTYLKAWILINIIHLEQFAESRGRTRSSGVFQGFFCTYIVFVYHYSFHIYQSATYAASSKLCLYMDPRINFP